MKTTAKAEAAKTRAAAEKQAAAAKKKVIACFAGHHHVDYTKNINGIYYTYINSMSYFWMGQDCVNVPVAEKYPQLM